MRDRAVIAEERGRRTRIVPVECLADNYAYLVVADSGEAAVVDAAEAAPVRAAAKREGATVRALWCTHHHWDHVGGNEELAREWGAEVVGHVSDRGRLAAMTRGVDTGDVVRVGKIEAKCIHIPGHTLGAVAYVVGDAVFTGDTLFCAGCGRLFEGTPEQMFASLGALAALAGQTRVYCGHEYTQDNLRFAAHVEPDNEDVKRAQRRAAAMRAEGKPTVGTTIDEEKRTNPFLRAADVAAFAALRKAKDSFR